MGGPGRIRIEYTTCALTGTTNPPASTSTTLGPVAAASTPALVNLPTLTISAVGGSTAPANPAGTYATVDMTLPLATTNPVTVTLSATNIPVGTIFTVKVLPESGAEIPFTSTPSMGTFANSTATVTINLPYGRTSLLFAYASYTQVAGLFPLINGEPVEQVLVAAQYGEASMVTLITQSGKVIPAESLLTRGQ
ncbi:MAG: hypothetical protein C4293_20760 [Nitrospiraceae bacterium]